MCKSFEYREWHSPFSGCGMPLYAECVSGAVVGDDCVMLVEGDRVSGSDDVMGADECCAKSIGDDR